MSDTKRVCPMMTERIYVGDAHFDNRIRECMKNGNPKCGICRKHDDLVYKKNNRRYCFDTMSEFVK